MTIDVSDNCGGSMDDDYSKSSLIDVKKVNTSDFDWIKASRVHLEAFLLFQKKNDTISYLRVYSRLKRCVQ